ncbi:YheC/YheD family protein [Neobacillus sp. WH10]|uniref:YheC/YheD family protein n=1 Tax=Neobacillus sp. WH10 TaxID=3047873 RepID=UPI0024C1EDCB|nr:YheC/YheD family protein [Neobacillus sp. WH10]WHY77828.1 YheC/YheD family protein [Neobacillus sp. WH10]
MPKWDKWNKYLTLIKNKELEMHLPETMRVSTEKELWDFTDKYPSVILKPVMGSRGRKIFKVSALESDKVEIHYLNSTKEFVGKYHAYSYFKKKKAPRRTYLAQRYISLANIQGRPFDLRVIVQKKKNSNNWVVTGKVAKLAGQGFFVTNNQLSSGSVLPVVEAIKASNIHIEDGNGEKLVSELERIALLATKTLEPLYEGHRIYGFDMGIDSDGHIWIIEANLNPALSHFYKLQDKTMYHTIRKMRGGKILKVRRVKKRKKKKLG